MRLKSEAYLRWRNAIEGCYLAELYPDDPERGYGYYRTDTNRLAYYSDGGNYFFEAGTGNAILRIDDDDMEEYIDGREGSRQDAGQH